MSSARKVLISPQEQARRYGLVFVATGGHLTGIPARDLSGEECQGLDVKQLEAAISSGLYRINNKEGGE
ncbi:MAG: hypothetical protein KJ063_02200 [Anaerolineae bacterium]|nr:hypothetical protein [Anaerolineae bacterium]